MARARCLEEFQLLAAFLRFRRQREVMRRHLGQLLAKLICAGHVKVTFEAGEEVVTLTDKGYREYARYLMEKE